MKRLAITLFALVAPTLIVFVLASWQNLSIFWPWQWDGNLRGGTALMGFMVAWVVYRWPEQNGPGEW